MEYCQYMAVSHGLYAMAFPRYNVLHAHDARYQSHVLACAYTENHVTH